MLNNQRVAVKWLIWPRCGYHFSMGWSNPVIYSWLFDILVGGWALPLWKMMDFVSWDDEIPKIWKVIKFHGSKPPTSIWYTFNLASNAHHSYGFSSHHYPRYGETLAMPRNASPRRPTSFAPPVSCEEEGSKPNTLWSLNSLVLKPWTI